MAKPEEDARSTYTYRAARRNACFDRKSPSNPKPAGAKGSSTRGAMVWRMWVAVSKQKGRTSKYERH